MSQENNLDNISFLEDLQNKIDEKDNEWTVDHEQILIEWADKAMCYRWLHSKATNMYSNLNALYTIPVIIISTLTGTANFAQGRVPSEYQNYFAMVVGAFNIAAGIISTIQQFLKITQLNEAHRVSSIAWDKFYRNIKVEISKHPSERINVLHMLKICKEELDRLMETSPNIPDQIISKFNKSFQDSKSFQEIYKPEICDILISTNLSRNPWFSEENKDKKIQELIRNQIIRENKQKKTDEINIKIVTEFIKFFKNINNRDPLENEIIDNLQNDIEISILKKNIEKIKEKESIIIVSE
jgi:hypothetical protein